MECTQRGYIVPRHKVVLPDYILQIFGYIMTLMILFGILSLGAFSFSFTCICSSLWETWGKRRGRPCRVHACIYLTRSYFSKHLLGLYSWNLYLSMASLIFPLKALHYLSFTAKTQLAQDAQLNLPFFNYQTSGFDFAP